MRTRCRADRRTEYGSRERERDPNGFAACDLRRDRLHEFGFAGERTKERPGDIVAALSRRDIELAKQPIRDRAQAKDAMAWFTATREFVTVAREAHELRVARAEHT